MVGEMNLDFDEEASKLYARINIDRSASRTTVFYSDTDAIYKHKKSGGTIYVGNKNAASNLSYLRSLGITKVVNCTHGESKIPDFHAGSLQYMTFPISHWQMYVTSTNASVGEFLCPLFQFINQSIDNGESVLVHCLAGAHRAGTTGVLCLMHYAGLERATATNLAKQLRPIIDPIGQLPELLDRYSKARLAAAAIFAERRAAAAAADADAAANSTDDNSSICSIYGVRH